MSSIALALAEFVTNVNYDGLPGEVIKEAKRRVADVVAIGLCDRDILGGHLRMSHDRPFSLFSLN